MEAPGRSWARACGRTARTRSRLSFDRLRDRLRPNGGDRRVEFRRRYWLADRALGRPMGARADRLDPLARMRMIDKAVRLEPERMQGVPEPAIGELQKRELRRSQDPASEARRVHDRHEARRGIMMRVHDLDGPDGRLGLRQNPI